MLAESEKKMIIECAKKYNVSSIILFGSSLGKKPGNDIDLGVLGLEDRKFFKFYGELIMSLPKPVDLVDLTPDTKFNRIVKEEGSTIYNQLI